MFVRHRLGVNYNQLPVNAPAVPIANFQRDGFMAFSNQGSRPNYQSSLVPLEYVPCILSTSLSGHSIDVPRYKSKPYEEVQHETWLGAANADLSFVTERE